MLHVQTADCGVCEWPSLDVELNERVARLVRYMFLPSNPRLVQRLMQNKSNYSMNNNTIQTKRTAISAYVNT